MENSLSDLHLVKLIQSRITDCAEKPALSYKEKGNWQTMLWSELGVQASSLAKALIKFDVNVQDKVAIFSQNSEKWVLADLAATQVRAVVVPIYPTNTDEQAAYIVNDSQAKVIFVGDQEQYDKLIKVVDNCASLTQIVLMNPSITTHDLSISQCYFDEAVKLESSAFNEQLEERIEHANLDDLLTLIYTSGTTGEPKGVMLDYRNFASTTSQHAQVLDYGKTDRSLAFLPLSHVFERGWTLYSLGQGAEVGLLDDPSQVQSAMAEFKPTVMCAVPRFYEKVYSAVADKVSNAPANKQRLFAWALAQGNKRFVAENGGKPLSLLSKLQLALADKLVLSKLRQVLGGNMRFMPCGGAKLDDVVHEFFQSIGITLMCGYGLTETTATVTCGIPGAISIKGNGGVLPQTQVKIGNNDEILVKGDTVMKGYYNRPQDTADVFEDGWFKTGDAGYLDEKGQLHITDRLKELMKTSNGKYIAPQRVEGMVGREPLIEQVAIVADARNYVSALIVPAFDSLEAWAKEKGIEYKDKLELIQHSDVLEHFERRLKEVQQELANFEQVKKFTLLPREFCMTRGELTPTLKLRRKVINQRFAEEIDNMYARAKQLVGGKSLSARA
nr:long-chain fatty acid--CoA ligase [Paraferrimonas haliotis]